MGYMKQMNINITSDFERDLLAYMKQQGLPNRSAAIRQAVHEAVQRQSSRPDFDFRSWLGAALRVPPRKKSRLLTEDDLWS